MSVLFAVSKPKFYFCFIFFSTVGVIRWSSSTCTHELVCLLRTPAAVNWLVDNVCQKLLTPVDTFLLYVTV